MIPSTDANTASSADPHITVSTPFSAPDWPPETGASTNATPCTAHEVAMSVASSALVVVWSTTTSPSRAPSRTPPSPRITWRTSSSLPTQRNTTSLTAATSAGVGAALPPWAATHSSAFAEVRL